MSTKKVSKKLHKTQYIFLCTLVALICVFILSGNNFNYQITNYVETTSAEIKETETSEIVKKKYFDDDIKIGSEVKFGRFYSYVIDGKILKDDLEWYVIDKVDDKALLMTKKIIKAMPFNHSWTPISWKYSDLRYWLNYDFFDIAFKDDEKELVLQNETTNFGNSFQHIEQDYNTKDYVFILSIEEVKKYFHESSFLIGKGTDYAIHDGLWVSRYDTSVGQSVWWLRNPGKNISYAAIVHAAGTLGTAGDGVATRGNGVRPCIWVKVE